MYIYLFDQLNDSANVMNIILRKQHHLINSPQFSLPLLSSHELKSTGSQKRKQNTGQLSRLELMSLAKFRNPETAEQVISWLEKTGAVNLSDK